MKGVLKYCIVVVALGVISCASRKIDNIVIVDVADFGREVIAREIQIIDSLNPAVIAIDLQFSGKKDPYEDSILISTLSKCKNLVMTSVIKGDYAGDDIEYRELIGSSPEFLTNARTGFANAILEDDEFQTLKRFSTAEQVSGRIEYHFAVRTAMVFDSLKAMTFVRRYPKIVNIDYQGGVDKFKIFSAYETLHNGITLEDIQGKIVLIGSFSPYDDEIFFSPLNGKKKPHTPDMYGIVYIANIVAQVLNHEDETPSK